MLIGICGYAGSGKDTIADYLESKYDHERYAFADPIKDFINDLMGWNSDHGYGHLKEVVDPYWGVTPRHAYQTFGTDWARKLICDDFWLKIAEKSLYAHDDWVIPDVRFENEFDFIKRKGGIIVGVRRNDNIGQNMVHESEAHVASLIEKADYVIDNNGTIDDLLVEINRVMSKINGDVECEPTLSMVMYDPNTDRHFIELSESVLKAAGIESTDKLVEWVENGDGSYTIQKIKC